MARWRSTRYKTSTITTNLGEGINEVNAPLLLGDGEATDMTNVISDKPLALNTRTGTAAFIPHSTVLNPTCLGLGSRVKTYAHAVVREGTTDAVWKWSTTDGVWTNISTTLNKNRYAKFCEYSPGSTTVYTVMSNSTQKLAWDGTSTCIALTGAPNTNIFVAHKGRLFWGIGNKVVYSAFRVITDYTTPEDSGTQWLPDKAADVTALASYNDTLLIFTQYNMYALYGSSPRDFDLFQLKDIQGDVGLWSGNQTSKNAICPCNGRLYWYWNNEIYEYSGATPVCISRSLPNNGVSGGIELNIDSVDGGCVLGSDGERLYVSALTSWQNTTGKTYVFDTNLRRWYVRTEPYAYLEYIGTKLVGVEKMFFGPSEVLKLLTLNSTSTTDDGTAISWYRISKAFSDDTASGRTSVAEIWLTFDLPVGSTLNIAYSETESENDFVDISHTFTPSNADKQKERIIIPHSILQNVDWFRIKLYGTGPCTIYKMEIKKRVLRP